MAAGRFGSMKNASDTIGNRSRALRVVAQCFSEMRHHVHRLHYVQNVNLQEINALLCPIRRLDDFRTSNPNLFTSFSYLVRVIILLTSHFPCEVAAASA